MLELSLQYRRTEGDRRRQKDKKRQNDKKTNKDRIRKKTEGQKEKKTKGDLFCLHGIVTTEYRKYF